MTLTREWVQMMSIMRGMSVPSVSASCGVIMWKQFQKTKTRIRHLFVLNVFVLKTKHSNRNLRNCIGREWNIYQQISCCKLVISSINLLKRGVAGGNLRSHLSMIIGLRQVYNSNMILVSNLKPIIIIIVARQLKTKRSKCPSATCLLLRSNVEGNGQAKTERQEYNTFYTTSSLVWHLLCDHSKRERGDGTGLSSLKFGQHHPRPSMERNSQNHPAKIRDHTVILTVQWGTLQAPFERVSYVNVNRFSMDMGRELITRKSHS